MRIMLYPPSKHSTSENIMMKQNWFTNAKWNFSTPKLTTYSPPHTSWHHGIGFTRVDPTNLVSQGSPHFGMADSFIQNNTSTTRRAHFAWTTLTLLIIVHQPSFDYLCGISGYLNTNDIPTPATRIQDRYAVLVNSKTFFRCDVSPSTSPPKRRRHVADANDSVGA